MTDPIVIPLDRLSPMALTGIIEEFITREGTDYGHEDWSFDDKDGAIRRQLQRGEAVIVFDPETETPNIVLKRALGG